MNIQEIIERKDQCTITKKVYLKKKN